MNIFMGEDFKRWSACWKSALVLHMIPRKTTIAEALRLYHLTLSEVEQWVEQGDAGIRNALRTKPEDIREQYER
jgi:hypothetical protein